jgi:hypothetical protein
MRVASGIGGDFFGMRGTVWGAVTPVTPQPSPLPDAKHKRYPSDGSHGIAPGVIYGYPVTVKNGKYAIVQGLEIDDFSRAHGCDRPGIARGTRRRRTPARLIRTAGSVPPDPYRMRRAVARRLFAVRQMSAFPT